MGDRLLACGRHERGAPDFFIGLIIHELGIPYSVTDTFSVNTISCDRYRLEARRALSKGVWHIHGIKTMEQLRSVIESKEGEALGYKMNRKLSERQLHRNALNEMKRLKELSKLTERMKK
jgi:hypothetical protein